MLNLGSFGRISMPVIDFSFWYSLGKWRECGVVMVGGAIMVMMV